MGRTSPRSHGASPGHCLHALFAMLCRGPLAFMAARAANQRFAYAFVAVAIFVAKIVHVVARERALLRRDLVGWMLSFFLQDFVLLCALRFLTEWAYASTYPRRPSLGRVAARVVNWLAGCFSAFVSVVNITFFLYTRSEVRWRDVAFASDSSSAAILLSGLVTMVMVLVLITSLAAFFQNNIFMVAGAAVDAVRWPFQACTQQRRGHHHRSRYSTELAEPSSLLPSTDNDGKKDAEDYYEYPSKSHTYGHGANESRGWRLTWSIFMAMQVAFYALRPNEGALILMSWTTPIIPFVDFKESVSVLRTLRPYYGVGVNLSWDNKTALATPTHYEWLPKEPIHGFEDWYEPDGKHYSAKSDPLFVSNLDQDILPQLADILSTVSIKHIVLLVLESTRKDVFPIKKDGLVWNRFEESAPNRKLSADALARLETLTPVANHLTGDFDDGFSHPQNATPRGGLNFKDVNTASTYTHKSMVGSMCGIWPLVSDFNKEYSHHVYQPCLPQILDAFSHIDKDDSDHGGWRSWYLQSITLDFDHAYELTERFGFPTERIIDIDYLQSDTAKFGKVNLPNVNYFGLAEEPLLDYFRDAFTSVKDTNERLFLTHVTSTTHHPYTMPADEKYVPLATGKWKHLSQYINSVGYDDRWLGKMLNVLDEENVSNDTLVIVHGDHGISIPENNKPAAYHNPNIGCNHVPLVLSHPSLPPIDITDSVSTMEILPTVLDLLRETGSLSKASAKAAGDLLENYEGQSLIRKLRDSSYGVTPTEQQDKGQPGSELHNWQFVVMNPGRAMVGVRDRRHKTWRLVVPVIHNVEWQFNDLEMDPTDTNSVQGFDFGSFLRKVEQRHGVAQAHWAEEAAFVARWWVEDNNRRYEYGPYARDSAAP